MKSLIVVLVVILAVALIFGSIYIGHRNEIVKQKEAINGAWAQVDVSIERRADLIPNLVQTVQGYAAHEQKAIQEVAQARAALVGARTPQERIGANERMDGAIGRLLVIVENYPNLKANENFLRLQDELAGTENRIAVERRRYNEAVQRYNTYIQLFPNNLVAGIGGFQRNDAYFKAEGKARAVPEVHFAQ
jgi:LemA protein